MALQASSVSLNLASTVNQAADEKVSDQSSMAVIQDFVQNKAKRLDKRPGQRQLPTTVQTSFPNPLSIGASPIPSGLVNHNEQLLLQNKGALYTFLENEQAWKFVGHQYPLQVNQTAAASEQQSLICPNMGKVGNISIYVYVKSNGDAASASAALFSQTLKYSVFDESTGAYVVASGIVEVGAPSNMIVWPQVLTFANGAYLLWVIGSNLKIASVNLSTGALGSITTLKTDVMPSGLTQFDLPTRIEAGLDWAYTNKGGVGERAFVTYFNNLNNGIIFAIKNDGTIDASLGPLQFATSILRGFGLHYHASSGNLFIGYQTGAFNRVVCGVCAFTSSALTLSTTLNCGANDNNIHAVTLTEDPLNSSRIYVIWDTYEVDFYFARQTYPAKLTYAVVDSTSVITSAVVWGRGLLLQAKAFTDTLRNTIYIPCSQKSDLYDTLVLADLLKGKAENAAFIQAKWGYGENSTQTIAYLPSTISTGTNEMTFLSCRSARISSAGTGSGDTSNLLYVTDIRRNAINLAPAQSGSSVMLNHGTHFSGGYLGYYDGAQFAEHSFFFDAEYMEAYSPTTVDRVVATVTQGGDGSHPQITRVEMFGGAAMLAGPLNYWTFSTTTTNYYVWYVINGIGSDPAIAGKIGLRIDITGNESAYELARKHVVTMTASTTGDATFSANQLGTGVGQPPYLLITNTSNGAVTAASTANFQGFALSPGVPVGVYEYSHVWTWTDANGQVMRSAPSSAIQITRGGTNAFPVFLAAYAPPITNRSVSDVKVEFYRSIKGPGSTLFRITSLRASPSWSSGDYSVSFVDTQSDLYIDAQQILYTAGGVLSNTQIPACKNVSKFKSRILASGMSPNEVYYSKTAINNEPIEFARELFIATDQDGDAVTAHDQLDDKLVVFKDKKIVFYAGDGANELGQSSTFSQPFLVASDVGCIGQNSVQVTPSGLYFQSKMGIQLLSRDMSVAYPGWAVQDFNGALVSRAVVLRNDTTVREIRFVLSGDVNSLVYNYLAGHWEVFSNYGGTDACLWRGVFTRVDSSGGVFYEDKTIFKDITQGGSVSYAPSIRTQWLKAKNVQDFQRVWRVIVLGELKSPHTLNFRIYYDYDSTNYDSYSFPSSNISGSQPDDSVYQTMVHLIRQKCQAIMVQMDVVPSGGTEESLTLTDMTFLLGIKQGLNKVKAQKQI